MRFSIGWAALIAGTTAIPSASQSLDANNFTERARAAIGEHAFIERARAATEKYHHVEEAVADGFRKVGPDMPNMGEHWIRIRHVLQASVRPEEPTVLTYLRVDGEPVLTGVAYTVAVMRDDEVPPSPVEGADWHFHAGSIQEEVMGHGRHASGPRLGMIHAWIWTENPDGTFAADNWALPFVRLGLRVPDEADEAAAKALFLLDGGAKYYGDLIESAAGSGQPRARALLEKYRENVGEIVPRSPSNRTKTGDSVPVGQLREVWIELWEEMRTHLDAPTMQALHAIAEAD